MESSHVVAPTSLAAVVERLGRFSDDMTLLIDRAFGSDWAENEEILALVAIATGNGASTRMISEHSGLSRRAVSRLVTRLASDGLARSAASPTDGRVVIVTLTAAGKRSTTRLRSDLRELFATWAEPAQGIADALAVPNAAVGSRGDDDPLRLLERIVGVGVRLVDSMRHTADRTHLGGRQRAALSQIAAHAGVRPSRLSPSLRVSPAGVAYVVDQLVAKGLVRRRLNGVSDDKRAVIIEVTSAGRQVAELIADGVREQAAFLAAIFSEIAETGDRSNVVPDRRAS